MASPGGSPAGGDATVFEQRLTQLRAARAAMRGEGSDSRLGALDAALTELELSIGELRAAREEAAAWKGRAASGRPVAEHDLRLLRAVFKGIGLPLLVLEGEGVVRRLNPAAAELLGCPSGYATGRPLPVFVPLADRATVRSQLAGTARDGDERSSTVTFAGPQGGGLRVRLASRRLSLAHGGRPLLLVHALPVERRDASEGAPEDAAEAEIVWTGRTAAAGGPAGRGGRGGGRFVPERGSGTWEGDAAAWARRMELSSRFARALLGEAVGETGLLQRAAGVLAGAFADWVVVDVVRAGGLERAVVATWPPGDPLAVKLVAEADPARAPLVTEVLEGGRGSCLGTVEDVGRYGIASDGLPLLGRMDAFSLVVSPVVPAASVGSPGAGAGSAGAVSGVVTAVRGPAAGAFTLADQALLDDLAGQLALALDSERRHRLQSEVTRALSAVVVPRTLPQVAGWDCGLCFQPARREAGVGGDFCDVFPTADGWAFALGDVCGKGEGAAALASYAVHAMSLYGLTDSGNRPDVLFGRVNRALVSHGDDDRFVTAVAGGLARRADGGVVTMVVAGHPPPVVVRADGRVEPGAFGDLPLGHVADAGYQVRRTGLGLGDLLVVYTDGVTDARDPAGRPFGEQRLQEVLASCAGRSAQSTADAVGAAVLRHGGDPLCDDVCVFAVAPARMA